jgi:hypothetical protein
MTERQLEPDGIRLSEEDRARMARLHEEVVERVAEMTRVIAGTLAQKDVEDLRVEDIEYSEVTLNPVACCSDCEGEAREGEVRRSLRVPLGALSSEIRDNLELEGGPGELFYYGNYRDPPGVCAICYEV